MKAALNLCYCTLSDLHVVKVRNVLLHLPLFESADIGLVFGGLHQPVETIFQMSDLVCFSETALCHTHDTL